MEHKSHELEIAIQAALEAGIILKRHFETDLDKEIKDDTSIVTVVDREVEELVKRVLGKEFSSYSFLGEEGGMVQEKSEYLWHVDPLDGTRNFANGIPLFSTSIALEKNGEIIMGVVYNPVTDSLFYAEKGNGAYLNGKKIMVSKQNQNQGMVTAGASKKKEDRELFHKILGVFPAKVIRAIRHLASSALELCYLARGGTEGVIQIGLQTYDFAAGVLIAKEAGAIITNFDGSPWKFPESYFVASNGVFHDTLLKELNSLRIK